MEKKEFRTNAIILGKPLHSGSEQCVCCTGELLGVISKFCSGFQASVLVFRHVCVVVGGNCLK